MPKGDAKVLQVLVAEVRKDGNINVVIGKELGVLLKPELLKPCRNLLQRVPTFNLLSRDKKLTLPTLPVTPSPPSGRLSRNPR